MEVMNSGNDEAIPKVITHRSDPLTPVSFTTFCTTSSAMALHINTPTNHTKSIPRVRLGFTRVHC